MNNHLSKKGWDKMRQLLDSEMPASTRRPFVIWWMSGAAVAAILIFSIQYLTSSQRGNELASYESADVELRDAINSNSLDKLQQPLELSQTEQEEIAEIAPNSASFPQKVKSSSLSKGTQILNKLDSQAGSSTKSNLDESMASNKGASMNVEVLFSEDRKFDEQVPVMVITPERTSMLKQEDKVAAISATEHNNDLSASESITASDIVSDNNILNAADGSQLDPVPNTKENNHTLKNPDNETTIKQLYKPLAGYLGVSSGLNIVDPVSYVVQFGGGVRLALSQNWGLQIGAGLGLNGLRHRASIGLVTESLLVDNFQNNNSSGQSLPQGTEAAELSLTNNWFTYLHSGIHYRRGKWSVGTGVDLAYRFGIQLNGISQSAFDANAMPAQRDFTGSEIQEIFTLYNRVDIRPILTVGYMVHRQLSLDLVYRHGLNPLLKYPLSGSKAAYNRNIQLGLNYHF